MQFLADTLAAGPFVLRVSGCAGLCGAAGQDRQTITASCRGTHNVRRVNGPLSAAGRAAGRAAAGPLPPDGVARPRAALRSGTVLAREARA